MTITFRRRDLIWAAAMVLILSAIWIAGSNRAEAGGAPTGDGIDVVYVAVSTNFPDSLGVGPGAGINGGPIILVPTDPPIPAPTETELLRLDPKKVVIIGGSAVVSGAMELELKALLPEANFERLGGSNRYETNVMVSQSIFPVEGWASIPSTAFTVSDPDVITYESIFGGRNYAYSDNAFNVLYAPIQLPDGATILEFKAVGYDGDSEDNLQVSLFDESGDVSHLLASVVSSGSSGTFTESTTAIQSDREVVDNENATYMIWVYNADGDPKISSVHIRYRLGSPRS